MIAETARADTVRADLVSAPNSSRSQRGCRWRRALLVAAPICWIPVTLLHPAPDNDRIYEDVANVVWRWIGVHFAQLVLSLAVGAAMWVAVHGRTGAAATLTRIAVPIWLVFFTAFDAVAGIGTGLAVHHAQSLSGSERDGAASTAEYLLLNHFAGDASPMAAISTFALTAALTGVALTFRSMGARRTVWLTVLGGVLLNFHAAGPLPSVGLLAISASFYLAGRDGLVT